MWFCYCNGCGLVCSLCSYTGKTRWDDKVIVVMDDVRISPPYREDNCVGLGEKSSGLLQVIKKKVLHHIGLSLSLFFSLSLSLAFSLSLSPLLSIPSFSLFLSFLAFFCFVLVNIAICGNIAYVFSFFHAVGIMLCILPTVSSSNTTFF